MKKTKRLISLILSIIMAMSVFSTTGIFAMANNGVENNHDASNGETIDPELCEHEWEEWVSDNDATIFEDGHKTRYCPICEKTETVVDVGSKLTPYYGWNLSGDNWYYFDYNLNMVTNSWMMDSVGWCYLGSDGKMITNRWVADSIGWCYLGNDGRMLTSAWQMDYLGWCYLNEYGYMVTNSWMMDSVGWCYLDSTGHCLTNSWMADSIGWCYLDAEGRMLVNGWALDSQGWCYLDSNGYLAADTWAEDSIGWVFLDSTGHMIYNTWMTDSIGWCYINSDGYMATNYWLRDNYCWYYMDNNGHMVTGWYIVNNVWYYFYSNGVMAANTVIDGYYVNENGQYMESSVSDEFLATIENKFLQYVNEERVAVGVTPLTSNYYLHKYAIVRSIEINTLFEHTRPNGEKWFTIIDEGEYPYTIVGENIFQEIVTGNFTPNNETAEKIAYNAFISFKNSPNHYENMINPNFDETGIAVYIIQNGNETIINIEHLFGTLNN